MKLSIAELGVLCQAYRKRIDRVGELFVLLKGRNVLALPWYG